MTVVFKGNKSFDEMFTGLFLSSELQGGAQKHIQSVQCNVKATFFIATVHKLKARLL